MTNYMRKKISWIMVFILMLSVFPQVDVRAVDSEKSQSEMIMRATKIINDKLQSGELINNRFNEGFAGVELDISKSGKYTLEYYTTNTGKPIKVSMDINVDSHGRKLEVTTRTYEKDADKIVTIATKAYREKDIVNDKWPTEEIDEKEFIQTTLSTDSNAPYNEKGSIIGIKGETLEIRYMVVPNEDGKLLVMVNGVEAGNIINFEFKYEDSNVGNVELLENLAKFTAEPVHLTGNYDEAKKDYENIEDITSPEKAGGRPGMKIEFKHPQEINKDTLEFQPMKDGGDINIQLNVVDYTRKDIQLNTTFSQSPESEISVTGNNQETGKKIYKENTHIIYLIKEGLEDVAINWDQLDQSRIMEKIELVIPSAKNDRLKNSRFETQKKGHTYLGFWIERTSETEAAIRYTPYQGIGSTEVLYRVKQNEKEIGVANGSQSNAIPIPFMQEGNQTYLIEIEVFGQTIYSQTLNYAAYEDENIPPPTPQVNTIKNIYAIPSLDRGNQPQTIGFDIEWTAPRANNNGSSDIDVLLDKGDLYYEMFLYKDETVPVSERVYSKIFKVFKNEQNRIVVEPYAGKAGRENTVRYDAEANIFTMENVILKSPESQTSWNQLVGLPDSYMDLVDYPVLTEDNEQASLPKTFQAPGTYYITMRAVYDRKEEGQELVISRESNPMSISIDETREVIPTVTQIESNDNTEDIENISQKITFKNIDLRNYYDRMLEPAGWHLWEDEAKQQEQKYRRTYEVFLYQENEYQNKYTEADFKFSEEEYITYNTLTNDGIDITPEQKEQLRQGKVIPIRYVGLENINTVRLTINQLDSNQVYYTQIRVKIDPKRELEIEPKVYTDYSVFSKVHSFTTIMKPLPPSPGGEVPPVPSEFWVEEQVNSTTITLGWKAPEYIASEDSEIYYEIARSTNNQLKDIQLDRTLSIEQLLTLEKSMVGFRTKNSFIEKIESMDESWIELEPKQNSKKFRLEDTNLIPDTIYYYYIRTVVMTEGEVVNSQWIMMPVTTQPVQSPIQLQVEKPDDYRYDLKEEVVISFLAPIPAESQIPEEYDFEIAVKGEKDEEYRLDYTVTRLTSQKDEEFIPTGYMHLVYKITGLHHGTRYDVKVRIVDKTKVKPQDGDYPRSLYSEKLIHRTEYDDKDAETEEKFEEYLKKYDSETEKLRRQSYWEVEAGESSRYYKYRQAYMQPELGITSSYQLASEQGISNLYYYFPANLLEGTNNSHTMLQSIADDVSITLRPNTISKSTKEIKEVIDKVIDRERADYYIGLSIGLSTMSQTVNGQKPVSPKIAIDMEVIELDEQDILIEQNIMDELNYLIDKGRERTISALKKEVELYDEIKNRVALEEKLDEIIKKEIETIKVSHKRDVKNILKRSIKKQKAIETIDKSILITSKINAYNISGYFYEKNWEVVYTFTVTGGYALEGTRLGTYIFASGNSGITISPEISGLSDLIGKYNLTDFFGIDKVGLGQYATKVQVYGALARVLGAKRGADYIVYLQSRGIQGVSKANLNQSIRQDEATYLIMQGYEKIHFKPINAIYIKNKQAVQNIGAFQSYYRPYIYGAVELGVIRPVNNKVLPSQEMTARDIINMLSKIVPK